MKTYFAKAYIGIPGGMATYGEALTEKQLEALGEERVHELVKNGCLGVHDAPDPAPVQESILPPASDDEDAEDVGQAEPPEDDDGEETDEAPEESLDAVAMDDLIDDQPEAEPEKPAKKGKGKAS